MNRLVALMSQRLLLLLLALFIAMPLCVVVAISFNATSRMVFPPDAWSLRWYQDFFSDPGWVAAFERSVAIAALASLLATSIALPLAFIAWQRRSRLARLLSGAGTLPFMLPPVIIAILFMLLWGFLQHVGQIENTIISHGMTFLALPLVLLSLGFKQIDSSLVEAARTLGARQRHIISGIVLPLITPYIASSLIFVAILSMNEYLIAYMVAGFTVETLPVKVFSSLRTGFTPTMCVGAVLFMLVGLMGFIAIAWLDNLPRLLGGKH